jgi:hypothetical protein
MGEAKRRKLLDANYGQARNLAPNSYRVELEADAYKIFAKVKDEFTKSDYGGTATLKNKRFDVQWYGETDDTTAKEFYIIADFLKRQAVEIMKHFMMPEALYTWTAIVDSENNLTITIKADREYQVFKV